MIYNSFVIFCTNKHKRFLKLQFERCVVDNNNNNNNQV